MTLSAEKRDFFRLMVEVGALQFGSFTLKSGRISPYFFNAARFRTAMQLERLGEFYAARLEAAAPGATVIFGPAYKGIPLCISAAMGLSRRTGREIGYLFNRKEQKAHGDQGVFVGRMPEADDRLALVDDVITDGGTKLEAVALLRSTFAAPIDALVIAFDRMERSGATGNALRGFEAQTGIPVVSVFTLADLEALLAAEEGQDAAGSAGRPPNLLKDIRAYRAQHGVEEG
jgi:orotate phosphoribosyltransferase